MAVIFVMLRFVLYFAVCGGLAVRVFAGGGGSCGGGGGGGSCGFGDSGPVFELPKVEEDVNVGGLSLKLDRVKWGYSLFARTGDGPLARFVGDDIEVTLRRISPPLQSGLALAESLTAQGDVLYARPIATSGAIRGVKAAYGIRNGHAPRSQMAVRYFLLVPGQSWLCFEARPTGKAPQWRDANDLILGAKPDRGRS